MKNGALSVSVVLVPVWVGVLTSVARWFATWLSDAVIVPIVPCWVAIVGVE